MVIFATIAFSSDDLILKWKLSPICKQIRNIKKEEGTSVENYLCGNLGTF